jgi:hypothetical protein
MWSSVLTGLVSSCVCRLCCTVYALKLANMLAGVNSRTLFITDQRCTSSEKPDLEK